jgi:hypothetical protein
MCAAPTRCDPHHALMQRLNPSDS